MGAGGEGRGQGQSRGCRAAAPGVSSKHCLDLLYDLEHSTSLTQCLSFSLLSSHLSSGDSSACPVVGEQHL